MIYKTIPNTELKIPVIALGTWVFGGDSWGQTQEKESIEAITSAIEQGINLIDTAPIYGYGRSEEIIGKAIKGKRDKVIIATKCGLIGKGKDIKINLKPHSIKDEIDQSLKRLNVDYVDIYQCHWPDPNIPMEETMDQMNKLKTQGKIRYIGVSNFNLQQLKKARVTANIVTLQIQYSLLERTIEKDILKYCQKEGIGILSYGSLGGGMLSGKYNTPTNFKGADARNFFYKFYKGKEFETSYKVVKQLEEISKTTKKPLSQIALNWIWQREGILSAIVGCRNPKQAQMNASSTNWQLSQKDIETLNTTNHIK